jgi:hypothetical protein
MPGPVVPPRGDSMRAFLYSMLSFLLFSCAGATLRNDTVRQPLPAENGGAGNGESAEKELDPVTAEYLREAESAEENLEIAKALDLILRARSRQPENRKVVRALKNIAGSLESEMYCARETVRVGEGLSAPLQFYLFYRRGAERLAVPDIPVHFDFIEGNGKLTGEAVTNDIGIAKCFVEEISDFGESLVIGASVALGVEGPLPPEIEDLDRSCRFSAVSLLDLPNSLVLSPSLPPATEREVCERLVARFKGKGFSRMSCGGTAAAELFNRAFEMDRPSLRLLGGQNAARILVLVDGRTGFVSQQSADFFVSEAEFSLKMIDAESFELYFESTASEKGAGPTRERSAEQALLNALGRAQADLDRYLEEVRRNHGV